MNIGPILRMLRRDDFERVIAGMTRREARPYVWAYNDPGLDFYIELPREDATEPMDEWLHNKKVFPDG